jgi:hypothetical protein
MILSLTQAAKMKKVTRQAIYIAIRSKRLKASKVDGKWKIDVCDLEEYEKYKYDRSRSFLGEDKVFDPDQGRLSVYMASKRLSVKTNDLYYQIRRGNLKGSKNGMYWVINENDLAEYKKSRKVAC